MEQARPFYETKDDSLVEGLIMLEFLCHANEIKGYEAYYGTKVPLQNRGDHVPDYRIREWGSQKTVGYAEIKCRKSYSTEDMQRMGGLFLSKRKYDMLKATAKKGYRVVFIVEFSDCIGYYSINEAKVVQGIGGRTDRGDPQDREQVVYFDPSEFKIVSTN